MTRISPASPVRRETDAHYKGKPLVVELHPGFIVMGEKRKKHRVTIDYATVYETAWKIMARAEAAQRKTQKKRKRG